MRLPICVAAGLAALLFSVTAAFGQGFPLMCQGGGRMAARIDSSGGPSLMIDFQHAPQGYLAARPGPGQCAWSDRPLNERESTHLLLRDAGSTAALLMSEVSHGFFTVTAFTKGGVLEISSVSPDGGEGAGCANTGGASAGCGDAGGGGERSEPSQGGTPTSQQRPSPAGSYEDCGLGRGATAKVRWSL